MTLLKNFDLSRATIRRCGRATYQRHRVPTILSRPACLLMGALLHFFAADDARDLVAGYVAALAPGSYVVLSVGRGDGDAANQGFRAYSSGGNQSYNHPVKDFTGFFGDLALVGPGVVDAREWHPNAGEEGPFPPRSGYTIVGVARKGNAG